MNELIKTLKSLPKDFLLGILYELMRDKCFTFHELAELHAKHLEELEHGATDKYMELQSKVMNMWCDTKKNHMKNLKGIMHHLVDAKRVNMTHEQVEEK